jgi:hypothetical protein
MLVALAFESAGQTTYLFLDRLISASAPVVKATVYSISEQDAEEVMGETPDIQHCSRPAILSCFCDFPWIFHTSLGQYYHSLPY